MRRNGRESGEKRGAAGQAEAAAGVVDERQIFVRNLGFEVSEDDLISAFESFGPLKHTSIAVEASSGKSKGFGFVNFSLAEDASSALQQLQGHLIHGRAIKLELGVKKENRHIRGNKNAERLPVAEATATTEAATAAEEGNTIEQDVIGFSNAESKGAEADEVLQEYSDEEETTAEVAVKDEVAAPSSTAATTTTAAASAAAVKSGLHSESTPAAIKSSRQLLVFGVPAELSKHDFKLLFNKGVRNAEIELLKEGHELSDELTITHPPGKMLLLTCASRKEAAAVKSTYDKATIHSAVMALGNQQKQQRFQQLLSSDRAMYHPRKEKLLVRTLAEVTAAELRKRKSRLIIRNLSFQSIEQNIVDKMSAFGPICSVELPMVPAPPPKSAASKEQQQRKGKRNASVIDSTDNSSNSNNSSGRLRPQGFAFVTFLCESDARAAVAGSEGLRICNREVAIDFCMSKSVYEKFGKTTDDVPTETAAATTAVGDDGDGAGVTVKSEDEVTTTAVAEGTNSETDEEERSAGAIDGGDDEEETDGADDVAEDEVEDDEEDDGDEEGEDDDNDGDVASDVTPGDIGSDADDDNTQLQQKKKQKQQQFSSSELPPRENSNDVHEGRTVFIRGLPFDANERDLRAAFSTFGRLALAVVVKDKLTGISKGSAFVKFLDPSDAERCIQSKPTLQMQQQYVQMLVSSSNVNNSGGGSSSNRPAPEAPSCGLVQVKDRICRVDAAVDRDSAQKMRELEERKIGKDKRNLYLANEGLLLTAAAGASAEEQRAVNNISDADRDKRQRAQMDKRKKLQNPLFFVSGHRLSVRNLNKELTDKQLREVAISATRTALRRGNNNNSSNNSSSRVTEADCERYQVAQGLQRAGPSTAVPAFDARRCVKAAKILWDSTRLRGGLPQSKGFGFIEFQHHAHALACLRELNNKSVFKVRATAAAGTAEGTSAAAAAATKAEKAANDVTIVVAAPEGRLIVEFAIENIQKVKILEQREARAAAAASGSAVTTGATTSAVTAVAAKGAERTKAAATKLSVMVPEKKSQEVAAVVAAVAEVGKTVAVATPSATAAVELSGTALKLHNKLVERQRQQSMKKRKRGDDSSGAAATLTTVTPVATAASAATKVTATVASSSIAPMKANTAAVAANSNKKKKLSNDMQLPVNTTTAATIAVTAATETKSAAKKRASSKERKRKVAATATATTIDSTGNIERGNESDAPRKAAKTGAAASPGAAVVAAASGKANTAARGKANTATRGKANTATRGKANTAASGKVNTATRGKANTATSGKASVGSVEAADAAATAGAWGGHKRWRAKKASQQKKK